MPLVVGVTFRRVGKVYYFDPGELQLSEGDFVIAETARGVEFGEVVIEPRSVPEEELVAPLKRVVRVATGDDLNLEASNRDRERHAYEVCERKIAEHNLPMKLLEAEYAFDGTQVTFSFSADGRVDFRELVKDVAGALRTKVQLHQIGVRDEAKLIGGYGTCGRPLCCATFLSNFEPISMKMAKDQSLFLNPAKFSGACGKLMCCLRYEHDFYKQSQKRLPAVGAILQLEHGRAKVVDVNVVSSVITIQTEEDVQLHIHASQLNLVGLCRKHGIACNMSESNCEPMRADDLLENGSAPVDDSDDDNGDDPDVITLEAEEDLAVVTRWRNPDSGPAGQSGSQRQDKPNSGSGRREDRRPRNRGGKPNGHSRPNQENRQNPDRPKGGNGGRRNNRPRRDNNSGPKQDSG